VTERRVAACPDAISATAIVVPSGTGVDFPLIRISGMEA
jgi:hypothetical protein